MIKVLDLYVEWLDGDIYWKNRENGRVILRSSKFSNYGISSDRVLYYLEADIYLPQYQYLVRTDSSTLTSAENTVIGVAVIKDNLYVQIQSGGNVFQVSKPYKNTITDEQMKCIEDLLDMDYLD